MRWVVVAAMPLFLHQPLLAQDDPLREGARLRIHTGASRIAGSLAEMRSDSLVLTIPGSQSSGIAASRQLVRVSDIRRLDVAVPRSRASGAGRGALIGAGVGAGLGLILGASMETGCFLCPENRAQAVAGGTVIVGALGSAIGLVVGVALPGSRWESTPVERLGRDATAEER